MKGTEKLKLKTAETEPVRKACDWGEFYYKCSEYESYIKHDVCKYRSPKNECVYHITLKVRHKLINS